MSQRDLQNDTEADVTATAPTVHRITDTDTDAGTTGILIQRAVSSAETPEAEEEIERKKERT